MVVNRFNVARTHSKCTRLGLATAAVAASSALALSSSAAFGQTWAGTLTGTAELWNVNPNWTSSTFPNGIGVSAILNVDFSANKLISLQQAITVGSLTMGDSSGTSTLGINSGTGTNALTFDASSGDASLTSSGGANTISANMVFTDNLNVTTNSSVTLSGGITGAGKLTKLSGFGSSFTLSGNNASWAGGISIQQGVVNAGSFTPSNAVLGTGTITFDNVFLAPANAFTALAINSNVSRTYTNNFVQNNASPNANGQYAEISVSGGSSGNRVTTFNGNFSTGGSYNSTQSLLLRANTTDAAGAAGLNESTLSFGGSWSSYSAGTSGLAIRIQQGSVLLNTTSSIANTGGYSIEGNDIAGGSKLILGASSTTMANRVQFSGSANGMRNSFGARHVAGTSTLSGPLVLNDTDGGNVFSQTPGAALEISGQVSGAHKLRINDGYLFTSGDSTSGLQTPAGTVRFSGASGNTNTGGVDVINGTAVVANTTGSGLGTTGVITIGGAGIAFSSQAGAAAINTRLITGVTTATAQALKIGQSIIGTNIPVGSVITGITIGSSPSNSSILISNTIDTATANVAFGTTAATTTAVLQLGTNDATGSLAPASSIVINNGSKLVFNRSDTISQGTQFSTGGISGAGGVEQAGSGTLTLTAANTYTGTTTVNAGVLRVNGSLAAGSAVTVATAGTLSGSGTVNGTVLVNGSGTISPGNEAASVGTLTLSATTLSNSAGLNFQLNPTSPSPGGTNDLVSVNGNFTLDGVLNVTAISGDFTSTVVGNTWRLFNYTGTLTNNLLDLTSLPSPGAGKLWTIDTTSFSGQVNLVVAVPEPAVLGITSIVASYIGLRRRRASL